MDPLQDNYDIEEIYNSNFKRIYKFFYYKVLSREIAEDLTSDTFLTLASILREQKKITNINPFIYGIAKNVFLQYLKFKYKKEITFSSIADNFEEYASNYVETTEDKETPEEKLLKVLDYIPEKQKIVIQLRFIEKLSLKEICKKLDKDMNYVKTTQKRAFKSLKNAIEIQGTQVH